MTVHPEPTTPDGPTIAASDAGSCSSVEDLDDGFVPDGSTGAVVDALEERVLRERNNPVLDVEEDADAAAVHHDLEQDRT